MKSCDPSSISARAESEVLDGNQFKKKGQIEMAINKYKCAIYLFIYALEDAKKDCIKDYYQIRINQILNLLNGTEVEVQKNPSSFDELKRYSSIPSNKSQILSCSESHQIRCTAIYPPLDQYPDLQPQIPTQPDQPIQSTLPQRPSSNSVIYRTKPAPISTRIISLNNFEKIKNLGFGSFGYVFLAKEKSTEKLFAIKELISIESSEDQRSFLREVEALSQAVFPAVLHLHGFCINPIPSIVTEYLPGGSLQDVINGNKLMNKTQRVKALYGVASAMRYLHDQLSIVHRDLKPANVMLNENLEPVVGDFGLAKMMTKMMMKQTQKAGSPVYMAPELMSDKQYTKKVDVYSFAILCYELLSELLAFDKVFDLLDLMNKVIKGDRPDLNNTKISPPFRELISKCWQNDAEKRPSFKEIVSELSKEQYLEGIDKSSFMEYSTRLRIFNNDHF